MRSMTAHLVWLTCAAVLVATATEPSGQGQPRLTVPAPPGGSRPVRLTRPRIPPLAETALTDAHRQLLAKHQIGARPGNAAMTLLTIPDLVDGVMTFQNYITGQSSLEPRHRELLILRTAWLLNNDYIWGEHAIEAKKAGFSAADLRRVAQGPEAQGWEAFDTTLLKLADELFRNTFVSDATWKALAARYDMFHLLDAVMTVTDFTTTGLLYNSFGVQPNQEFADHIPLDVPYRITVPRREPDLRVARVQPLAGTGLAIQRTFANYPKLAGPRGSGADFVNRKSKLDPQDAGDSHPADGMGRPGRVRVGPACRQRRSGARERARPAQDRPGSRGAGLGSIRKAAAAGGRRALHRLADLGQNVDGAGHAPGSDVDDERHSDRSELSDGVDGAQRARCPDRTQ